MSNCQFRHQNCKMYEKKYEFKQAKRMYPKLDSPIEQWDCTEAHEKTCKQFKAIPARMTVEEYKQTQDELLKDIPEELQGTISYMAYEEGHSAGYEEVIGILRSHVSALEEPLKKFEARVRSEYNKDHMITN